MTLAAPTAEQATQWARWIESRGWKPTPLHVVGPDQKTCSCPKGRNCGNSGGKHNIAAKWQEDLRGSEIFEEMARRRPKMNVGILTGEASGIFVLDIDPKDQGFESIKALIAEGKELPATFVVRTGTGGYHYYFQMPDFPVRNNVKKIAPGLDIRGNGGMVVAPPSVSYAGAYSIAHDAPVAPAPEWLLDMIRPKETIAGVEMIVDPNMPIGSLGVAGDFTALTPSSATAGEQTRQQAAYEAAALRGELHRLTELQVHGWAGEPWDNTTFEVACNLLELANAPWTRLSVDEARARFLDAAPVAEVGYDPSAKWASALDRVGDRFRPPPEPSPDSDDPFSGRPPDPTRAVGANREGAPAAGPFGLSDRGNADRLIAHHGNVIRYAVDAEAWLTWDRGVWSDMTGEIDVEAYLKSALDRSRASETELHSDTPHDVEAKNIKSDRSEFVAWLGKSEFYARVQGGVKYARSDMRLRTTLGVFDADPMLLNTATGAVNLTTGETFPHDPAQMFRHQTLTAYNPAAKAPLWEAFLGRVQPDPAMRHWLQRVLGYSITGRMDEHAIFIHSGPGATGKTTFLEVVLRVMGGYGQKLERETLLSKQGTPIPADIARMHGKRFLGASETATGRKLDDERVKELVGGDTQTARHLFGKWFEFQPTGKIHMATNHLPGFESGGTGMGRRLRLVPWEVEIPPDEQDRTLKDRIVATEAEGVLAWLVEGAKEWAASPGLITPEEVQKRSDQHIEDADPVLPFIHERLEVNPDFETEFEAIYGAYASWSNLNGNKPMSGRAFSMALKERLGADSKFLHVKTRRSMFRVRVKMMAVPSHHEAYAARGML